MANINYNHNETLLTAFIAVFTLNFSVAETFTVTNLDDSGPGSLRAAFQSTIDNTEPDVINITVNGIIELTSNFHQFNILPSIRDLTINGDADGDGNAIVLKSMTPEGRFFQMTNVTLNDMIFDGGMGSCTAGALLSSGTSFINRCLMINGISGAMNHSCAHAGALRVLSGTTTLNNCTMRNNTSGAGAAIWIGSSATATLESCTIADNIVFSDSPNPAAIYLEGTLNMTNCIIANTSPNGAVDIFDEGNTVEINENNLIENFVCRTGQSGCANLTFASTEDPMLEPTTSGEYFLYNLMEDSPIAGMGIGAAQAPGGAALANIGGAAAALIPTMGEWGAICLCILLLTLSVVAIRAGDSKLIPAYKE